MTFARPWFHISTQLSYTLHLLKSYKIQIKNQKFYQSPVLPGEKATILCRISKIHLTNQKFNTLWHSQVRRQPNCRGLAHFHTSTSEIVLSNSRGEALSEYYLLPGEEGRSYRGWRTSSEAAARVFPHSENDERREVEKFFGKTWISWIDRK